MDILLGYTNHPFKGKAYCSFWYENFDITNVGISTLNGHADCKKHVYVLTNYLFLIE